MELSWLYGLLLMVLCFSCMKHSEQDTIIDWQENLQGVWVLESATRQGRATQLLDNLYMTFDGAMVETNYPDTLSISYQIIQDTLVLNDHVFDQLEILSFQDSLINFGFTHKKNYFSLVFSKIK